MKDQPYMPQCDLSKAMTPQEIARHQAEIQLAFADGAEIEVRSRLKLEYLRLPHS